MKTITLTLVALCGIARLHAQDGDNDMLAGMSAMRKQDHSSAEVAFTRAVTSEPQNMKAWYYRGVNRLGQGDLGGALKDLDEALHIAPDDAHCLLRRAEVRARLGAEFSATTDLERLLVVRPIGPAAEHALLHLGHFSMGKNDFVAAKGYYDCLIGIAPYNAFGWCDRGIVLAAMHQDDAAIADLERAIELDPELDQAYVQLALAYFRQERKQEGCEALGHARDIGDRSVEEMMAIYCE